MNAVVDKNYSEKGAGKFNKLDSLGQVCPYDLYFLFHIITPLHNTQS